MMAETLEQVLTDIKGDELPVLRKYGGAVPLAEFESVLARIERAAEQFTTFLPEADAMLRSGHTRAWLRARFAGWERQGHARKDARGLRSYRECVVPAKVDLDAVRADAARTARGAA